MGTKRPRICTKRPLLENSGKMFLKSQIKKRKFPFRDGLSKFRLGRSVPPFPNFVNAEATKVKNALISSTCKIEKISGTLGAVWIPSYIPVLFYIAFWKNTSKTVKELIQNWCKKYYLENFQHISTISILIAIPLSRTKSTVFSYTFKGTKIFECPLARGDFYLAVPWDFCKRGPWLKEKTCSQK